MALIGEELASDTMLDQVMCICSGRRPKETCTEDLTYQGPSRGMVTPDTGMNFGQELSSLSFGDASLKYSGSALLVELSVMDLVGFRAPDNAASLVLILGKFLPS